MSDPEEEKTIEELCKPLSAKVNPTHYTISGKPISEGRLRGAQEKSIMGGIRRKAALKGKKK